MNSIIAANLEEFEKTDKEFHNLYHKLAVYFNLSDTVFRILYVLYNNETESITQKELCDGWYFNKQTINSAVKNMQLQGYITLELQENNRKNKKIKLSEKGKELAENTVKKVMKIEYEAFKNFNEMNRLIELYKKQYDLLKTETEKYFKENLE